MFKPAVLFAAIGAALVVTSSLASPPALAAETPSPAPSATQSAPLTWAVRPADATAPDGRTWIEQTADPGSELVEHLAVTNFSQEPVTFRLDAADGYFTRDGHFTLKRPDEEATDAGRWIAFSAETIAVDAGATAIVPFTVTVPGNATPGDHAAGVAAGLVITGTSADGADVGLHSRVGFRVMVQVSGDIAAGVSVSQLSADYEMSWNPFSPGRVTVRGTAVNSGNTWIGLDASVSAGASTAKVPASDLLPGETADLAATLHEVWPLGPIAVDVAVTGTPNDDGITVVTGTRSVTVWALPLPQLLVLLAAVAIVWGSVVLRRRDRQALAAAIATARAEGRADAFGAEGSDASTGRPGA